MRYYSRRSRTITIVAAAAVVTIGKATSDFHNNDHPSNWHYSSSPYLYNEIRTVDLSSDDENDVQYDSSYHSQVTRTLPQHPQDSWQFSAAGESDWTEDDSSASVVASSLLYDGGCYVSSQAIMCQGGGGDLANSNSPVANAILQHFLDEDVYSEDDEEDDDGDDDGHSSMLSNGSLKRTKTTLRKARCFAGAAHREPKAYDNDSRSAISSTFIKQQNSFFQRKKQFKSAFLQQQPKSSPSMLSSVLRVRGGAAANVGSELTKKLINVAIVTLIFEGCCGHILEFFKIVMQTSPPGTTYGSVFKEITSEKGLSGLWDGFVPWGVLQAVLKGGVFGVAYEATEKILVPLAEEGKIPMKLAMTLAGGIAGGFQGFVLSPTLLMKTRVMTNEIFRESMSLWQTTWKAMVIGGDIIKKEGLGSLMKGADTFATKRVFDWASRYFFADLFEALFVHLKGGSLSVSEKSIASLLGGVASTVLTLPLDVLVAKTQDAKKAGVKVSAMKLFSDELEKEGWVGLKNNYMKGFEARLLHVCLTTVVIKTMSPIVYTIIFGK
ncbi:mitochondrial carrier protein [Nitzschia inconspicua]|uniref:Mitochondrial carrier protein n=1 Tax=Nitzschia inconspicua TaxID=303405 RepID=A0A9K3LLC4_9STRA|nr:mitochondrial carrier protein [Nitzschia inconspicua]